MTEKDVVLFHHRTKLEIPNHLKNEIGFNKEGTIYFKDLTDNITRLREHTDKDSLLDDQLQYLDTVYTNKQICIELLESFEKNAYEKLLYVYRLRNKIMHNAYSESNPLIELNPLKNPSA